MQDFYVTFGVSTVLRNHLLQVTAPDEISARTSLNRAYEEHQIPSWCTIVPADELADLLAKHAYEVFPLRMVVYYAGCWEFRREEKTGGEV